MTREEAKRRLLNIERCTPIHTREDVRDFEALEMAIKALEQEPSGDLISRQAVFEQIHCWIGSGEYRYAMSERFLIDRIKTLPSVKQEWTGHWISHYDEDEKVGWYECDRCHTERAFNTKFCPDCGARMVEQERSDKE